MGLIAIKDDGVGLEPEMFGKIFDVFMQVDSSLERSQSGLGIGLSLVRSIARLLGGEVTVKSDGPGRGCQFVVSLPLMAAAPVGASAVPLCEGTGVSARGAPLRR